MEVGPRHLHLKGLRWCLCAARAEEAARGFEGQEGRAKVIPQTLRQSHWSPTQPQRVGFLG